MSSSSFRTEDYLAARLDTLRRQMGFRAATLDEWRVWRADLRATLRRLLGVDRLVSRPLNPRVTETMECDGYRRERVEIDTEPGVTMPLYVLVPDGLSEPAPAVIAAHGHSSGGKISVAGCTEIRGVSEKIEQYNYDYGVRCVRRGYVVFCPDARGAGERRERAFQGPEHEFESSCFVLAHMGLPLGITVAGMWAWDLSRLVDYVRTRPESAGCRVGCIGLSGGGLQTLYLSALDDRIDCAVISGYFYGVKDSLLYLSANCSCNYVPHLWEYADMGDIGALVAPTPLLIEAGRQDELNGPRGIDNVLEQYEIARQAYDLLEFPGRIDIDVFEGGHRWNGKAAMTWLDRWLCR